MAKNQKTTKPRSAEKKPQSGSVSEFEKLLRFIVNFKGRFALAFICGEDRRRRDLISQQIKCPILFWVSTFALTLFAREAPDFYDFRYTVFNFPVA